MSCARNYGIKKTYNIDIELHEHQLEQINLSMTIVKSAVFKILQFGYINYYEI